LFASGAIIYAYVGGNPVNAVDPTGLVLVNPGTVIGSEIGTIVFPGPGTIIGGVIGIGIGIGVGALMCQDDDESDTCEENLKRDLATCEALGKRNGKKAYKICEGQAMLRYSNCLAGRDKGAPLPPWGERY
jgi:hypothetical protein